MQCISYRIAVKYVSVVRTTFPIRADKLMDTQGRYLHGYWVSPKEYVTRGEYRDVETPMIKS